MSICVTESTREEIINAFKHGEPIITPKKDQTQEETNQRLIKTANIIERDEVGKSYKIKGTNVGTKTTVTSKVKEARGEKISRGLETISETPDNKIYKDGGNKIHYIRSLIMNFYNEGRGDLASIQAEATSGSITMSASHFNSLVKDVEALYNNIQEQQKKIDPNGKVLIYAELPIVDPLASIGSTIDVLALFSDNTASIYDFKNKQGFRNVRRLPYGAGYQVLGDLHGRFDLEDYELQLFEYKRILTEVYGVKDIRQSRILPSLVRYKQKEPGKSTPGESLLPEIAYIKTSADRSEDEIGLAPLPVAGEKTGIPVLDEFMEKLLLLQSKTEEKISTGGLSRVQFDLLKEKTGRISRIVRDLSLALGINNLAKEIDLLTKDLSKKLAQEELKDGVPNPEYVSNKDLIFLMNELAIYKDLLAGVVEEEYQALLTKQVSKEEKIQFLTTRKRLFEKVLVADSHVNAEVLHRKAEILSQVGIDNVESKTHITDALNVFKTTSEIDNPIFKAFVKLKDSAYMKVLGKEKLTNNKILDQVQKLETWAKSNGLSGLSIYDPLINRQTGNLHDKYTREFWLLRKQALKEANVDWFKEHHLIKKGAEEFYNKLYKEYTEHQRAQEVSLAEYYESVGYTEEQAKTRAKKEIDQSIKLWVEKYDAFSGEHDATAFSLAGKAKIFYELNSKVLEKYETPEYKKIKSTPALIEFYEFTEQFNHQMRDVLNLGYQELPPNFIPNVRKNFVEQLFNSDTSVWGALGKSFREISQSFSVREDDTQIFGIRNPNTGEVEHSIPIYFLNPFKEKTDKAFDLGRVMLLFSKMAYNYQAMNEIEGHTMALKAALALTPQKITSPTGSSVKSSISGVAKTYLKNSSDIYKLFEDHTNYYLYGVRMKVGSTSIGGIQIGGVNLTKGLLAAKNYLAWKTLGLAIVPGLASFVASKTFETIEARKGILFTGKQHREAYKELVSKKGIALLQFFEAEQDSATGIRQRKLAKSKTSKYINSDVAFFPYRIGDRSIDRTVLIAMSKNYGFNKDGELKRMVNLKAAEPTAKSIFEASRLTEKGDLEIDGISHEGMIAFRNAVRHATKGIKGSLTAEDIKAADVSLGWSLVMQFKNWMPGFIAERAKGLQYNPTIDAAEFGRYRAFKAEFEKQKEEPLTQYFLTTLVPNLTRLAFNISMGWLPGVKHLHNTDRARKYYIRWAKNHPQEARDLTYEQFTEVQIAQTEALVMELRIVLAFAGLIVLLGLSWMDDEEKALYSQSWAGRKLYQVLVKAENELTFLSSPSDFVRMATTNPIPISRLLLDAKNTIVNMVDETGDILLEGEKKDGRDKTPILYYTIPWIPGGIQARRMFELFEQDKKNPYPVGW